MMMNLFIALTANVAKARIYTIKYPQINLEAIQHSRKNLDSLIASGRHLKCGTIDKEDL